MTDPLATVIGLLERALPDDPGDHVWFARFEDFTVHVLTASSHVTGQDIHDNEPLLEPTARLLNQTGVNRHAVGDYRSALDHLTRALAILERVLPADHPNIATSLNNLGEVHRAMGNHPAALDHHTRAHAIRERVLPPDHPDTRGPGRNFV